MCNTLYVLDITYTHNIDSTTMMALKQTRLTQRAHIVAAVLFDG